MLSKHNAGTPKSSFLALTQRLGLLAFLLLGLAANVYAQNHGPSTVPGPSTGPITAVHHAPEIAVGAGISAFVLAGGGLLLLADRLRRKKKSKS